VVRREGKVIPYASQLRLSTIEERVAPPSSEMKFSNAIYENPPVFKDG
jgi:hypothetical protein